MFKMDEFIQSSLRIFNVARKPGSSEYRTIAKITGFGIILIGVIGFVVKLLLKGLLIRT